MFKSGDKVITQEGKEGVVDFALSADHGYIVQVGNKFERWLEDGLTKIEEPKFKDGDSAFIKVKLMKKNNPHSPYPYEIYPLDRRVFQTILGASEEGLLTKEDIINGNF